MRRELGEELQCRSRGVAWRGFPQELGHYRLDVRTFLQRQVGYNTIKIIASLFDNSLLSLGISRVRASHQYFAVVICSASASVQITKGWYTYPYIYIGYCRPSAFSAPQRFLDVFFCVFRASAR